MDIDIATYRVRIGTFNPRALNLKTKVTKPKRNSEKNFSIYNYLRSILYIILLIVPAITLGKIKYIM